MHESTPDATRVQSIDLAQEADFDLGSLRVRPASCEVEWNGVSQTLQRRVMQVLVALARARGSVVSQNDLVVRCWRGLSVSDDAIVRCISKLRKLAAGYPDAPFAIETIPGVGYRLTSPGFVEHDPRGRARGVASPSLPASRMAGRGRTCDPGPRWVRAIWIYGGARRPSSSSRRGAAIRSIEQFRRRSFAGAKNPERNRQCAWRQPDRDRIGGRAGGKSSAKHRRLSLIVTGILRDDGRQHDCRRPDRGRRNPCRIVVDGIQARQPGRASDLPLEVAARVADVVNMVNFARSANPPLTDDSALSALLQTTDMIRDPRGGAWAQMIERAQGLVARHPEFAFGHSVLAAAYAEAATTSMFPIAPRQ